MAKRFTDTNKYKKPFLRNLPGAYKLLWDFLYHDCDHAGIWIVDFEIAQTYVGKDMPITQAGALTLFNDDEIRIVKIDGGKKWFIPSFILFQYGKLSEKNRAHLNVISVLKKYDLINSDFSLKPLTSPLQGAKEKEQEKEQEMEKEQEKETFENSEKLLVPEMEKIWVKHKPDYPKDKIKDYTALQGIAFFICEQSGINYAKRTEPDDKNLYDLWGTISEFVSTHKFFKNYSLKQIENHIQSITQEIKNGKSDNQSAKSAVGKVNGQQVNAAFAKFYSQGQPVRAN
jgi:hypothetical protein